MTKRPLFVIVGAMKCGTTSLHAYLDLHPQIGMSNPKEPNFFNEERTWNRGLPWFYGLFDPAADVWGESSTNYTKFPRFAGVVEKIHHYDPATRLIYVVRDPVARVVSHYMTNVAHANEARTFDEAMADLSDNHYLHTSRYHAQLTQYLRLFPMEQIRVVELGELSPENVRATLRGLFAFVGVDADFDHPDLGVVKHDSSKKRRPTSVGRAITHGMPGGKFVRYTLSPLIDKPLQKPVVTPALRRRIEDALRPDADALRALTGRTFSTWSI